MPLGGQEVSGCRSGGPAANDRDIDFRGQRGYPLSCVRPLWELVKIFTSAAPSLILNAAELPFVTDFGFAT